MKSILAFTFFLPLFCFSQKSKDFAVDVETFDTYAYVGNIRLDSINALYAQVEFLPGEKILAGDLVKRYVVDYGQKWDKVKEIRLTNKDGQVLTFNSLAKTLNLFDFNGWTLVDIYNVDSGRQMILFKKKK